MGVITAPTTLTDGTIPTAAQFNGDFSTIYNEFNGSIDNTNIKASAGIAESKVAFSGTGHGHTGGTDGKAVAVNRAFAWFIPGTLTVATNQGPRYVAPEALTITKVWLIVRTAPTGAAILIDLNKNGAETIWSSQANRATIAAAATSGNTTTFNATALAAGDYLDLDIDQVGSSVAGTDLTVVLECSQP